MNIKQDVVLVQEDESFQECLQKVQTDDETINYIVIKLKDNTKDVFTISSFGFGDFSNFKQFFADDQLVWIIYRVQSKTVLLNWVGVQKSFLQRQASIQQTYNLIAKIQFVHIHLTGSCAIELNEDVLKQLLVNCQGVKYNQQEIYEGKTIVTK